MDHISQQVLTHLLAGKLAEEEASRVFGHLAFCGGCADRLHALRLIREDFSGAWDVLTDGMAGRSLDGMETKETSETEAAGAAAAGEATDAVDTIGEGHLGFAVRVLIDGASRLAAAGTRFVREYSRQIESCSITLCPAQMGVGDPQDQTEINRLHADASAACDAMRYSEARQALQGAGQLGPGGSEVAEVEFTGRAVRSRVVVDSDRRSISVLVYPPDDEAPDAVREPSPGRVSLIDEAGMVVRTAELERVAGAAYFLAEFEDVSDAGWVVQVEVGGA